MSSVHETKKFEFDVCNNYFTIQKLDLIEITDRFTKQKISMELFEISAAYLKE